MAEQSIGMTSGLGDGVAGGYVSGRMTAMEQKTLSNGILMYTTNGTDQPFALSGSGTSTLTIGEGAAMVSGFFYENTSSLTISLTSLASATYNLVVVVNNAASTLAVSRASVSATTIPAYSVRLALMTSVPSAAIQVATVTFNGTSITAINYTYGTYDIATSLSRQAYVQMTGGAATITSAATSYDIANYTASTPSVAMDKIFSVNTTTGVVTVNKTDLYMVSLAGTFSSGTTSWRSLQLFVNGVGTTRMRQAASGAANQEVVVTALALINAGEPVKWVTVSGLAAQSFSDGVFTIARV